MNSVELVDSSKKLLAGPEIIASAVANMPPSKYSSAAILTTIAGETTLPDTDIIQIGNTVFLAHYGEGENRHKMVGRAFNMDPARNFVKNGFKYFDYLQRKGYTHYSTSFTGPVFLNAFKVFKRRLEQGDTQVYIGRRETDEPAKDKSEIYVRIGKEPLSRGL